MPTFGAFAASGCVCGRAGSSSRGRGGCSPIPRGVSGTSAPPRDAGWARPGAGAAGSGWGLPFSSPPARQGLPAGLLLLRSPSCPYEEREAAVDPDPTAPGWPRTAKRGVPRAGASEYFCNTVTWHVSLRLGVWLWLCTAQACPSAVDPVFT